ARSSGDNSSSLSHVASWILTQRLLGVGSTTGAGAGAGAATGGGGGAAVAAASGGCTQAHSEPDKTPDNSTKAVFPFIALLPVARKIWLRRHFRGCGIGGRFNRWDIEIP